MNEGTPTTLYPFSYDRANGIVFGTSHFSILKPEFDHPSTLVNMDLSIGYESVVPEPCEENFNLMFKAIVANHQNSKVNDLRTDLGNADIVAWQSLLTTFAKISCNSYSEQRDVKILAQRYNGVILLDEYPSFHHPIDPKVFYMGHNLRQILTTSFDGKDHPSCSVDISKACYLAQTKEFKTADDGSVRVFYTSKVDALKSPDSNEVIEIKTHKATLNKYFYPEKGILYWSRGYFAGLKEIVMGLKDVYIDNEDPNIKLNHKHRNNHPNIVQKIKILPTRQIEQLTGINPERINNYIAKAFLKIKQQFEDPNVTYVDMIIAYTNVRYEYEIKLIKHPKNYVPAFQPLPQEFLDSYPKTN
uniref:Decapping nuclease n=1 Tax=Rhabditophanes sp. KR3021 TaxID=114890 RepID=A0AC35TML2_9BILA